MRTVSSYGAEIRKPNIPLRLTMKTYRQAVGYLTEIYAQVWEELRKMPSYLRRSAIQHALGSVSSYETRLGSGKRPECCPEGRNLPAGTMPCRSFTGM